MINKRFIWLAILPLSLLAGCEKRFSNVDELDKYVKRVDSPFLQTVSMHGVKATLRYLPSDEMLLRKYRAYTAAKNGSPNPEAQKRVQGLKRDIEMTRDSYQRSFYFLLTFGYEDGEREIEYEVAREGREPYPSWIQKLMFHMQDYISLESPTIQGIHPDLCSMERTYGMTKDRSFLLAFPNEVNGRPLAEEKSITLRVKEFGLHTGQLEFQFEMPFENIAFAM